MDSRVVLTPQESAYLQMLEDLNKPRYDGVTAGLTTRLHAAQIEAARPLITGDIDLLFIACGRKFGKTELALYILWRHALENPGSACYYVTPENAHGRKLVWDTWRLQKFMEHDTKKYLKGDPKSIEMKVNLKNGSFIQVIGSENWAAANGLTPSIVVYDEFKAFHPQWHIEFNPNRISKKAKLVIIGTLPKAGDRNIDQYNDVMEQAVKDPRSKFLALSTFDNPINRQPEHRAFIEREIAALRARGEDDVVEREYFSKIVPGGKRAVFPMFSRDKHVVKHDTIMHMIHRDLSHLQWYLIADPGTTTCFGALFIALNPYTKKIYVLDEIYEQDQRLTSTSKILPVMLSKAWDLYPKSSFNNDWDKVYDEAGAWFSNEVLSMSKDETYFRPTDKMKNDKETGLSLIKDQFLLGMLLISHRCVNLCKELESYAKNDKGVIPKGRDHLIDCLRYFNGACAYDINEIPKGVAPEPTFEQSMSAGRVWGDEPEDWTDAAFDIDMY